MEPLNIIIIVNNISTEIGNIVNYSPTLSKNSSYKNTHYFIDDKTNWKYFLIQDEYNSKTKSII